MGGATSEWWASIGPRKVKSITYKEAQWGRRDGKKLVRFNIMWG